MPRIEWVTSLDRFAEIKDDWDKVAVGEASPFLVHDWFASWWNAFVPEGAARVCTLWEGNRMVAAFPLWASGRNLLAMANYYSDTFRPIATDEVVLSAVIEAVFSESSSPIILPSLVSTHPSTHLIVSASKRDHRHTSVQHSERCPIVDMNSEPSEYRSYLTANTRKIVGRKRRKFEKDLGAVFRPCIEPNDLDQALKEFLALEAKGWKGRSGTAIHLNQDAEEFYSSLAIRFGRNGAIRMGEIRLGDRLVAAKLCILYSNRLYALKEAFDEEYSVYSPSMTLLFAMVEHSYEAGLEALELLGDAEPMKVRFGTSERRTLMIRSYKPGPISTATYLFWDKAVPALKPYNDRRKERKKAQLKAPKATPGSSN